MVDTGDSTVDALILGLLDVPEVFDFKELTYTFELTSDLLEDPDYSKLNQASIDRHLEVFGEVTGYTGITFTEVKAEAKNVNLYFTFLFDVETAFVINYRDGILHNYNPERDNPVLGTYIDHLILHELGHGLGLKHGHDEDHDHDHDHDDVRLPDEYQGHSYSVMSYRAHPDTSELFYSDSHGPETFMLADIAALQFQLGINYAHQSGDTTYTVDFDTGELFIDGNSQGVPVDNQMLRAIWDGGGEDLLDLSNAPEALSVDLRPGEFTSFGESFHAYQADNRNGAPLYAEGNIGNPHNLYGNLSSLLEDADGGDFNDLMYGNVIGNALRGGNGDDAIYGMGGDDNLSGGAGDDLIVDGRGDTDVNGGNGNDFIVALSGSGDLRGGAGRDAIVGGSGSDVISGGADDDILRGEAGRSIMFGSDRLDGGLGNDMLMGGGGADVFVFAAGDGADTIASFEMADIALEGSSSVTPIFADFTTGVDRIELNGFDGITAGNVLDFVSDGPDGAVFAAQGTRITFFDVQSATLQSDDFLIL